MAMPAFEPAFELCREMPSLSSSSASKFFFQRFIVAPTGVRLHHWLDNYYTDNNYRNYFIFIMDDTITNSQGLLSGGSVQTSRGLQRPRAALAGPRRRPRGALGEHGLRRLLPDRIAT